MEGGDWKVGMEEFSILSLIYDVYRCALMRIGTSYQRRTLRLLGNIVTGSLGGQERVTG